MLKTSLSVLVLSLAVVNQAQATPPAAQEYTVVFVGEGPVRVTLEPGQVTTVESKALTAGVPKGRITLVQTTEGLTSQFVWRPQALKDVQPGLTMEGDTVYIERKDAMQEDEPILFTYTEGAKQNVRVPAFIWPVR